MISIRNTVSSEINRTCGLLRTKAAELAYIILCIRGCLSWLAIDTFVLTVVLNLLILFAIDYRHLSKKYLLCLYLAIFIPHNPAMIGTIDLICIALIFQNTKIEKIAAIYLGVLILFLFIWLFMYNNGLLQNKELYSDVKGSFNTYGFNNPNGLGMFSFHIYSCLFFLLQRKSKILTLLLIVVINEIFFWLSRSRTPWFGGIVFIVGLLSSMLHIYKYKYRICLGLLPALLAILCFFLVYNYKEFILLDMFLSGRLTIQGPVMAGMSKLEWLIGFKWPTDVPLDCSYILLLFQGGIILVSIFCILSYRMVMYGYYKIKSYIPFIMAVLACGCAENTFAECTGLSVMFWYLILNYQGHDKKVIKPYLKRETQG